MLDEGPRDGDRRAKIVIAPLAVRDHDVQAIGRAALEDRDQHFLARALLVAGEGGALQPERRGAHAGHRDRGIAKKNSA